MAPKTARSGTPAKSAGGKDSAAKKTARSASAAKERPDGGDKSGKKTNRGDKKRAVSTGKQRKGADGEEKKSASDTVAEAAADVVAEEAASAQAPGKPRRPRPELLKSQTTGMTAVVEYVEEDEEESPAPSPDKDAATAAAGAPADAPPAALLSAPSMSSWQCSKWLAEVQDLIGCISTALCTDTGSGGGGDSDSSGGGGEGTDASGGSGGAAAAEGADGGSSGGSGGGGGGGAAEGGSGGGSAPPAADVATVLEDGAALAHVRALSTREDLLERLRVGGALEKLTDAIWPKLEILKAGPATASEVCAWRGWRAQQHACGV